jgi:hypothetical protein
MVCTRHIPQCNQVRPKFLNKPQNRHQWPHTLAQFHNVIIVLYDLCTMGMWTLKQLLRQVDPKRSVTICTLYLVRRRRRLNKKRQKRPNGNHCVFARRAYVLVTRNTFVITLLISKCTWSTSPTRKCIGRHPRGMRWWWWCCGGRVISEMYPTNRPLSRVKNIEVIVVIEEQSKCFFSL